MSKWDELEESWAEKRAQSEKIARDTEVFLEEGGTIQTIDYRRLTVDDFKAQFNEKQRTYRRVFSETIQ